MSIRKFADLANETDSRFNNLKDTKKRSKISDRFDDTTHNELAADEALQFLNKKLDECIDSINTNIGKRFPGFGTTSTTVLRGNTTTISNSQASAITTNSAKTGITTSQANAITANSAKTGITTSQANAITANSAKTGITNSQASAITANTAKVSYDKNLSKTSGITLNATVTENRGSYTLVFTMTHGRVTKTAEIRMS